MLSSTKNTDSKKEKLPALEELTITVKKNSDKTSRVVSLDRILLELSKNQENDIPGKENNFENLIGGKSLVSSSSTNANCAKTNSGFSSGLNKNECEIIKIQPGLGLSKDSKHSRFLRQPSGDNEANNAPKQTHSTANDSNKRKTESELPSNPGFEVRLDRVEKKKSGSNQSAERNEFSQKVQEPVSVINKVAEESDSRICVIEKVFGNAVTTFSSNDDITFSDDDVIYIDTKETQVIVPKKTDDITKIKGWRRKQFFVEKPTTVEFQEISYGGKNNKKKLTRQSLEARDTSANTNVKNAFVCESLDEFLEQDAKLKINYEIPHLYAEFGIKLTKEEIASAPSLSEKDIKEVETKYCRPISNQIEIINLDDVKPEKIKKSKRQAENEVKESFKIVKLENNNMRLVKVVKKSSDKPMTGDSECSSTEEKELKEKNEKEVKSDDKDVRQTSNDSKMKLESKVVGLVVYPSPHNPLHPVVQFHLKKLRSYRTAIDSNWANFAASVVKRKDSKYKRCILPAKCCVKVPKEPVSPEKETTNVTSSESDSGVTLFLSEESENIEEPNAEKCCFSGQSNDEKFSVEELKKMKDCKVLVKKLDTSKFWCEEHDRFNCNHVKNEKPVLEPILCKKTEESGISDVKEQKKTVIQTFQTGFYEDIAVLLAKKLKIFHPDVLTSIDSLKTLKANAVELIKLKFIQKSFLHRYISIWYLKPQPGDLRSRAFLTFSKTPPVKNAVNLRYGLIVQNLPKVIREIVYSDKYIDANEYALLYCNGQHWEIHGSVNIAFNKSPKSTEQVMIPSDLPELKSIQDVSFKILKTKAVKWWVLDLTQQFQIIELKSDNVISKISQKKLLGFTKHCNSGFIPFRTYSGGRIFGAYMVQSLLPYVLFGPYHLLEIRNMSLKEDFSALPFLYSEIKDSKKMSPLQFHISSIIKNTKENGKRVEGLWLHCRTFADHPCFLEVMTAFNVNTSSRSNYSISDEHGYSLSSAPVLEVNRKEVESNLQGEVYLYFDIFGLGYVLGVLEEDNSVTISHPLNERTKVNSSEIGNWFLRVVRRRIQFVPKNLVVNWFITKHKSLLRNRQPFNKNYLNGAHILTDSGIFYVFKLSESNLEDGKRKKYTFLESAGQNAVVEEVFYLKVLTNILVHKFNTKPSMDQILKMAVKEIEKLKEEVRLLERVKECLEEEKFKLFNSYLITMNLKGLNKNVSLMLLKEIENLFFNESGDISEAYVKKLQLYSFGRQYLKMVEKRKLAESDVKSSPNIRVE